MSINNPESLWSCSPLILRFSADSVSFSLSFISSSSSLGLSSSLQIRLHIIKTFQIDRTKMSSIKSSIPMLSRNDVDTRLSRDIRIKNQKFRYRLKSQNVPDCGDFKWVKFVQIPQIDRNRNPTLTNQPTHRRVRNRKYQKQTSFSHHLARLSYLFSDGRWTDSSVNGWHLCWRWRPDVGSSIATWSPYQSTALFYCSSAPQEVMLFYFVLSVFFKMCLARIRADRN